jgi:hypothetical protein
MYQTKLIREATSKILRSPSLLTKRMSSSSNTKRPIIELREYELLPSQVPTYTQLTTESSSLRKSLTPLRLFTMPETGGTLNTATHFYYFENGFEERNTKRGMMGQSLSWKEYLKQARGCMKSQKSSIYVEAPLVATVDEVCGLVPGSAEKQFGIDSGTDASTSDCIYEIRRYQLKLGYDTVPKFLSLYEAGLPSKLKAHGTDPTTSLVTLLYSEVGQLNEVIEIWRHGSTSAMERSRVASRSAEEWRSSRAQIADLVTVFTSSIHKPLSFSPL